MVTKIQHTNLEEIFNQAQQKPSSLCQLLDIGRKQGFGNTINRRFIWPFLLGLNLKEIKEKPLFEWKKDAKQPCLEYNQIRKDTERAFANLQGFESVTKFHMEKKQEALLETLNAIFLQNQQLNYLQGFHEVSSVVLVLFDENISFYLLKALAETYFYDLLTFQFGEVGKNLSNLVYELVIYEDSEFKKIFSYFESRGLLVFIFPWILTWFVYTFKSLRTVSRIWDYILCTGPQATIYLAAGLILSKKKELIAQCERFNEAEIHEFFQHQTKNSEFDAQFAIEIALLLENKIQLNELKGFRNVHPKSKLRVENFQKILPLHQEFHRRRRDQIKKYKTIGTVAKVGGVALIIGAALLIRKYGRPRLQ